MWMPLDDLTIESGPMRFALRTHNMQESEQKYNMTYVPISSTSGQYYQDIITKNNIPVVEYPIMEAGDATFHLSSTIHSAHGNTSTQTRKAFTVRYIADGMRVMDKIDNDNRWHDLKTFIPDRKEGELVDSWKNPILC
jgi:ectoine hydroxylase-related dioxygenase (phytanoyl-CoA dioxygenase family)